MTYITDETIDWCIAGMEEDWQPFNDIYRAIDFEDSVFMKPTEKELRITLDLIKILLTDYNVVCLKGPEMIPLADTVAETMKKLEEIIKTEDFEDYHYGLWFDMKEIKK